MIGGLFWEWYSYLPSLISGLEFSLVVTILSLTVGLPAGLMLALLSMARAMFVRACVVGLVELGRGAPALVVLQFVFFAGPAYGFRFGPIAASVVAFAWNTAAYTSEMFRGGFLSVPRGMIEAATSVGLTPLDTFRYIVLPEGLRVSLPALMGWAIIAFQGTSLCFTIGLPELLSRGYEIASVNFEYLHVLVLVGVLYAIIAIPAAWLTRRVERRLEMGT